MDQAWPVAYQAGAIAHRGFDELGSGSYEIAHPTLYVHSLAFFFRLFGETDVAARLTGLLCFLGVSWLLVRLSALAFPGDGAAAIGGMAALMYAVSPISIQHSLIVDQTTTILPLSTVLFLCLLYRYGPRPTWRGLWFLGASFALCLWSHESMALILLLALVPFCLISEGPAATLRTCGAIVGIGLGLFAVSWLLYCWATGVPPLGFVQFSVVNKLLTWRPSAGGGSVLGRVWLNGKWLSAGVVGLLAVVVGGRAIEIWQGRRPLRWSDFLAFYAIVVLLVTNAYWNQMSRYQFIAYGPVCVVVAEGLQRWRNRFGSKSMAAALAAGALLALPLALKLGDPILMTRQRYLLVAIMLPAAGILAVLVPMTGFSWRRYTLPLLLGISVSAALWTDLEQTGPYTTSVSWSEYGETGFSETLRYLEQHATGTVPVIRKDLAYALLRRRPDRSLKWVYTALLRRDLADPEVAKEVEETLLGDGVVWVVIDRYCSAAGRSKLLAAHFDPGRRFGDFRVFKRRTKLVPAAG